MNELTGATDPSNFVEGLRFIRRRWGLLLAISILLVTPIFWHQRIEAGDLASHTYNAWLATLATRGHAPGIYVVRQWTNVLVDVSLKRLGGAIGLPIAEKVVVALCVLIFFWGAFALITSATRRAVWFVFPAVAMIAYGWTFQMGFLNYYLSLGFGFFAVAVLWRGKRTDYWAATILIALSFMAHPFGFVTMTAIAAYVNLADRLKALFRWLLLAAALAGVLAIHLYLVHHYETRGWPTRTFFLMNGSDQLVLYGSRYTKLAMAAIVFAGTAFLYDRRREKSGASPWRFRTPFEVWAILLFAAAMIPEWVRLPWYAAPVAFSVARLTSITAVMGLCVLAHIRPRLWHLAGCSVIALAFFAWMYQDTGVLNRMESQAEGLVATLPQGRRVVKTIWPPPNSRIYFINHMIDRACIGHCFSFANYEPASQQFRLRVRPDSPVVTDSAVTSGSMDQGHYVVQADDLPMTEIYQCGDQDLTRLCVRDLTAGEQNGRMGYHPPVSQ
jgi:hypothetical protein